MKSVTIIGAGAVGRSIALALFYNDIPISGIFSRFGISAQRIAKTVNVKNSGTLESLSSLSSIIILCVPDAAIKSTAEILVKKRIGLKGRIIVHTSGALSGDELVSLKKKGAKVGSFHPMQTFPKSKTTILKNTWIAIEGDNECISVTRRLAEKIGAGTFVISKEAKVQYHIAGVFASNYVVTLMSVVEQIAKTIAIPREIVWKVYQPIVDQSVRNAVSVSPKNALTGPIVRGDLITLRRHLRALRGKHLRHLLPLYSALAIETARLAKEQKRRKE